MEMDEKSSLTSKEILLRKLEAKKEALERLDGRQLELFAWNSQQKVFLNDDRREVFVKVRSTRPPQAAWLRHGANGCEVELVDGEHGVSPGQACVFYDAGDGQARVLGGGFIKSAVAAGDTRSVGDTRAAVPAMRS